MSWYRVVLAQAQGQGFGVSPDAVYRSPEFPHVFLGAADEADIQTVEKITGRPVCIRVDLRSESNKERNFPAGIKPPQMRVPLPDEPGQEPATMEYWRNEFEATVNQLAEIIASNDCPIYVHCSAGMNRSVATLSAALAKLTGRGFTDVLKERKELRPMSHPNAVYRSWGEQVTQENRQEEGLPQAHSPVQSLGL